MYDEEQGKKFSIYQIFKIGDGEAVDTSQKQILELVGRRPTNGMGVFVFALLLAAMEEWGVPWSLGVSFHPFFYCQFYGSDADNNKIINSSIYNSSMS